jgi:hypothetical protein
MYKNCPDHPTNGIAKSVIRTTDGACIPFATDNTDYQQFKKDIQNGVVLNDAEGNPITGAALTTFMETLP